MGYTTEFRGRFKLNKKLDDVTHAFLSKLNETRRMRRVFPNNAYGIDGEFYVDGSGDFGQGQEENILDYNTPPRTQPSLWCQWRPTEDGTAIEWDGSEKFYEYVEWIRYIILKILAPKGYTLTGEVEWQGEDSHDMGMIVIHNNEVTVKRARVTYE